MFIVDLPYSRKPFGIKILTFEHILTLSRLFYDNNSVGAIDYLIDLQGIRELNVIDKFFVLLKAKELFVNEDLSLSSQKGNINIKMQGILNMLLDLPNFNRRITTDGVTIELDLPTNFIINPSDLFTSIIQALTIEDVTLSFNTLTKEQQNEVLRELPSSLFNNIKDFTYNTNAAITIFKGKQSLEVNDITLNFFTTDPFMFIKSLYNEYQLHACREILFYLSKRLPTEFLLKSTPADIQFYMAEYTNEIKSNKSSGSLNQLI